MATARGQQRGAGVTGIHVWLIAFVALWLVSTVLLVWLYTGQTGLVKTADDLRLTADSLQSDKRDMDATRDRLAELAVGASDDDLATVETKIGELFARIQDEDVVPEISAFENPTAGVLTAMTALYDAYLREHQLRIAARDQAADAAAQVEALAAERTAREQAFDAKQEELTAEVREIEQDRASYRSERNAEIDRFDERIEALRQQASQDIQEQRNDNSRLKQELAETKSRLADLQEKMGELQIRPAPLLTARQGDGRVLMARPGEEVVYINLGRRDRVTRGMQFAVYSPDAGIPSDGSGKARIEVSRIFDAASECIVREMLGHDFILEGDIINNPIYDRTRSLSFVVRGRFDFDGDGRNEADGADRIRALIREWGGQVVEAVTARVDFVVLGDAPRRPPSSADGSPEAQEREASARRVFDDYNHVVETAQALSVPVLPQSTFLHFLGFAGGT